jgi:4-alpha-glucanotransferase
MFKVIKAANEGKAWYDWPEKLRQRDTASLEDFAAEHGQDILFQKWLQWQLCLQFKDAKFYAASKKVFIKGDLPILVSRDSADVWSHREFFKLEFDSGAPPDMYCAKGQRWGTCTYNWQKIFEDNGTYIKEKLAYAGNFYDLIRLDHVVGLFRIWSIPVEEPAENFGLNGFFDPKDKTVWEANGRKILSFVIKNTGMLLCAEDLGTIPPECPKVLNEFGIPGNDVQRWTKEWEKIHDFLPPEEYRFLSVTMLSTHDTTNWPAWWENEAGTVDEALFIRLCAEGKVDFSLVKDKLFDSKLSRHGRLRWKNAVYSLEIFLGIMGKKKEELWTLSGMYENSFREKEKLWKLLATPGEMREKCDAKLVAAMVKYALASRSVFCFNLILDLLFPGDILKGDPYNYRINVPGTVAPSNWSLLLPLSLEQLLAHPVCEKLRQMNERSGRA